MITPINEKKEAVGVLKPLEPVKTGNSVVAPKEVFGLEEKEKDVPRDQVGMCDNLTASYWG